MKALVVLVNLFYVFNSLLSEVPSFYHLYPWLCYKNEDKNQNQKPKRGSVILLYGGTRASKTLGITIMGMGQIVFRLLGNL